MNEFLYELIDRQKIMYLLELESNTGMIQTLDAISSIQPQGRQFVGTEILDMLGIDNRFGSKRTYIYGSLRTLEKHGIIQSIRVDDLPEIKAEPSATRRRKKKNELGLSYNKKVYIYHPEVWIEKMDEVIEQVNTLKKMAVEIWG